MIPSVPSADADAKPIGHYIKHLIIIIQENRSLVNLFAGFPGADAPMYGYLSNGKKIQLHSKNFNGPDVPHAFVVALTDWDNGKMDGYDQGIIKFRHIPSMKPTYPYAYLDRKDAAPYWTMAKTYVLADHMFEDELGPSYTSHFDLITATSLLKPNVALVDTPSDAPWGCDAPKGTKTRMLYPDRTESLNGPFPCFSNYTTLAGALDAAKVPWKFYSPKITSAGGILYSSYDGIRQVRYGPDWKKNVISPQTTILTDAAKVGGLAAVSWVVPPGVDSDHQGQNSDTGPSWVAAIVNAVGQGPSWKSSAIVVLWDDWGGWYDNAAPPQLDFMGLGERVACLIISPYARPHYVSHTQYEFGSVLKFAESAFNLQSVGDFDVRAKSIYDAFDFKQKPLPFHKIPAKYPASHFLNEQGPVTPPDDE